MRLDITNSLELWKKPRQHVAEVEQCWVKRKGMEECEVESIIRGKGSKKGEEFKKSLRCSYCGGIRGDSCSVRKQEITQKSLEDSTDSVFLCTCLPERVQRHHKKSSVADWSSCQKGSSWVEIFLTVLIEGLGLIIQLTQAARHILLTMRMPGTESLENGSSCKLMLSEKLDICCSLELLQVWLTSLVIWDNSTHIVKGLFSTAKQKQSSYFNCMLGRKGGAMGSKVNQREIPIPTLKQWEEVLKTVRFPNV